MATEIWPPSELDGFKVRVHRAAARDIGPERALSTVNKDVMHNTEGNFAGDEDELTRDDSKIASCHALFGRTKEQGIVAMVPLNRTAYTPGNDTVARASINLELSGFKTQGYTQFQYEAAAAYHRWAVAQGCPIPAVYVGKTGEPGILGHQDVPNPFWPGQGSQWGGVSGHTDPGPLFDWNKFVQLCAGPVVVPALPYGVTVDSAGALIFPINGANIPLNFGFKDAFLTLFGNVPQGDLGAAIIRGVKIYGLPVAPEVVVENGSEQEFEFCWFGFNRTEAPGWQIRLKKKSTFQAA